jgi:hypothetical protein
MENHDSAVCSGSRDHESVPNLFSMARTMSFKFQLLETVANEHEALTVATCATSGERNRNPRCSNEQNKNNGSHVVFMGSREEYL